MLSDAAGLFVDGSKLGLGVRRLGAPGGVKAQRESLAAGFVALRHDARVAHLPHGGRQVVDPGAQLAARPARVRQRQLDAGLAGPQVQRPHDLLQNTRGKQSLFIESVFSRSSAQTKFPFEPRFF